jgi:HEAT repeat protein
MSCGGEPHAGPRPCVSARCSPSSISSSRQVKESADDAENSTMRFLRRETQLSQLRRLRDEGDLDTLASYVNDPESSPRLRRQAAVYIASTKPGGGKATTGTGSTDPDIVPILAPLLEHDRDRSVRRAAAYGLRRTGDESAVQPLLRALSDKDKATRIHAIMGLGELRSRAAVEPLSELLDDRACARNAAKALVEIGDESALPALKSAAASATSGRQRKTFAQATVELEARTGHRPPQ